MCPFDYITPQHEATIVLMSAPYRQTSVLPRSLSRLLITLGAAFIGYLFLNLSPYQEGILVGTCAVSTLQMCTQTCLLLEWYYS